MTTDTGINETVDKVTRLLHAAGLPYILIYPELKTGDMKLTSNVVEGKILMTVLEDTLQALEKNPDPEILDHL